jgi:hypothetical protein
MDTMEDYHGELQEVKLALAGLLRYLGHQGQNRGLLDIRFCLPTELYPEIHDISTNAMKDFSSQTILRWHAGDLLRVVAHRLSLYVRIYDNARWSSFVSSVDLNRRDSAHDFLCSILPKTISTRSGFSETPIAYILRHTQLLPRHVIVIFNRMMADSMASAQARPGEVPPEIVKRSVAESLDQIFAGIAKAYKYKYPHLRDICREALPELSRRFKKNELQTVFNRHVSRALKRLRDRGEDPDLDFFGFERMLIEVGAIGKQVDETDHYFEAEFEYTIPYELVVAQDDWLCLHPVFSGCFRRANAESADVKRVYPRGSDPLLSH